MRLVMESNREGMGYSQQGLHQEAHACFSHALRWCPMPHEMASLAATVVGPTKAAGRGRPRKRLNDDDDDDDDFEDDDVELERKLHGFQWQTRRAAVMNNLGMTAQALGKLQEAEEMLQQTIQLRQACLDQVRRLFARETEPVIQAEQEQIALALSNARRHLASVYAATSRASEAIEQLAEAVAIIRSKTTPQRRGPFLALALNNLATVRIKQSLLDEQTETHLKEAVQLLSDDPKTTDLLVILKNLRLFYSKTEQTELRDAVQKQIDAIAAKEDTARFLIDSP